VVTLKRERHGVVLKSDRVPDRQHSLFCPTREDLHRFFDAISKVNISPCAVELFRSLACVPPDLRLAINLKTFLGLSAVFPVIDILRDGLSDKERLSLVELDGSGISVSDREVAHGLLNVHERWIISKALSKSFRNAKAADKSYVDRHLLGDILGREE